MIINEEIKIDVSEEAIFNYSHSILELLLKDRTTSKNIIWATDAYLNKGNDYEHHSEIRTNLITGKNRFVIQPRISKSIFEKTDRTKKRAEVFTPSWICNEQNNLIDDAWFNRKNVFNISSNKTWKTNEEKIIFPQEKNKDWKSYIKLKRMEIACGEAPYLVSRYDTVTGEFIELTDRIGLLDRKMRIINENTETEKEWLKWTEVAFKNIYGFEFQGDNLLLARENLLATFIDNLSFKFNRDPLEKELKKISTIISWNLWQMDGLTFKPPYANNISNTYQISLFNNNEKNIISNNCLIKDWDSKEIIEYKKLINIQY